MIGFPVVACIRHGRQMPVQQALEDVGESARFDSYTDLPQAIDSFI